jgi:hypothetical protein
MPSFSIAPGALTAARAATRREDRVPSRSAGASDPRARARASNLTFLDIYIHIFRKRFSDLGTRLSIVVSVPCKYIL